MTLALDLGNSSLKAACFDGEAVVAFRQFVTGMPGWQDAFREWLGTLPPLERTGLASVVPHLTPQVCEGLRGASRPSPLLVRGDMPLPLRMAYTTPETLGADRVAAAIGAWEWADRRGPVVAVDAGTALTYEVVTYDGAFAGGAIAPGPDLLVTALSRGTAQLPEVPFVAPPSPVGDHTRHALQAGLVFGFLDGVHGMLTRLRGALGPEVRVVATGGWASWLADQGVSFDAVRPYLVLEGIRALLAWQADQLS